MRSLGFARHLLVGRPRASDPGKGDRSVTHDPNDASRPQPGETVRKHVLRWRRPERIALFGGLSPPGRWRPPDRESAGVAWARHGRRSSIRAVVRERGFAAGRRSGSDSRPNPPESRQHPAAIVRVGGPTSPWICAGLAIREPARNAHAVGAVPPFCIGGSSRGCRSARGRERPGWRCGGGVALWTRIRRRPPVGSAHAAGTKARHPLSCSYRLTTLVTIRGPFLRSWTSELR